MTDYIFYEINNKSEAYKLVEDWRLSVIAYKKQVSKFRDKHIKNANMVGHGNIIWGFTPPENKTWDEFLNKVDVEIWRRDKKNDFLVPRKKHPVYKEWISIKRPIDSDAIAHKLTGLDFLDLLQGLYRHNIRMIAKKGYALIGVPYFATKHKNFKLIPGIKKVKNQIKAIETFNK
jgi:hypothetical protein